MGTTVDARCSTGVAEISVAPIGSPTSSSTNVIVPALLEPGRANAQHPIEQVCRGVRSPWVSPSPLHACPPAPLWPAQPSDAQQPADVSEDTSSAWT